MYEIHLTCYDYPYNEPPHEDAIHCECKYKMEAQLEMLKCIIDEAESLNIPDADFTARTNIFVISRNCEFDGKKYDAAIVMWDGANGIKEQVITGYNIVWVNKNKVDEYNRKLRDVFGDYITVEIRSEFDECELFYYFGASCGESDRYETIEEAYKEAYWYLDSFEY